MSHGDSRPGYRLVMLDFDGTLADSFPWFLRVMNELAERHRFRRIEEHEVEALRSYGSRELMRHLRVAWWKLPLIQRHARRLKARDLHTVSLFPGMDDLLRRLDEAGVALAIVSSNAEANVRAVLGPANAARIDHFECGVSLFGKRAGFARVLKRLGVPADDALCVGDEIRDLEAAHACRIRFAAVAWGYTTPAALAARGVDHLFTTPDEVVETVLGDQGLGIWD